MSHSNVSNTSPKVTGLSELAKHVDYSLLTQLNRDPQATDSGEDHSPRQVFSGHYVPVKPIPITAPKYVAHSKQLFSELGFDDSLATDAGFTQLFSGDTSQLPAPMKPYGWATGYALSIYGTEYTQQCPFRTGNGYGDGRAMSVVEGVFNNKRWEMQLKGGGPTPYCRGADGRAVLRSSVREFLAQEHMHALGVATSRSLSLYVSSTDTVERPWYFEGSHSTDPEIMVSNPVAISTRVAPSFLRVGQLELFGRRARKQEHDTALEELEQLVLHIIEREYTEDIASDLPLAEKVLMLAESFKELLTSLVTDWIRVGYCQGNFNSDNCSVGGFTLDYGPFGFCEAFEAFFQPWTGGGQHFSFLNQPAAAEKNFDMFCSALKPLLASTPESLDKLDNILADFWPLIEMKIERMWASKLGLETFDADTFRELIQLMVKTPVDYTMFFRELSAIPSEFSALRECFYKQPDQEQDKLWNQWFVKWHASVMAIGDISLTSQKMKQVNPKYTWREWLVVPAYQQAAEGDYSLIHELQSVLTNPYDEQSTEIEEKYYKKRPLELFGIGGVSHYSCSS
ncbi:YdiU family protein [Thalassotalea euphylliae]|uniref:protein adenylyltransferase SelO n=1 Tax=Thalassotalea euphylliae TaxID=1655234 RepID=UPI0036262A1D